MAAASSDRIGRLLTHLYGAAEVLIESIADPDAIDATPLNHRAQALDAVSRFIQRLEKVNAAAQPAPEQGYWDPNQPIAFLDITPVEQMVTEEDLDHYVALAMELPGRFSDHKCVQKRIEYLRRSDPVALSQLDPDLARAYFATSHVAQYTSLHTVPPGVKTAQRPAFAPSEANPLCALCAI